VENRLLIAVLPLDGDTGPIRLDAYAGVLVSPRQITRTPTSGELDSRPVMHFTASVLAEFGEASHQLGGQKISPSSMPIRALADLLSAERSLPESPD